MTIPPNLPRNDREALALIAWHALLCHEGNSLTSAHLIAEDAFKHADRMLEELRERRGGAR